VRLSYKISRPQRVVGLTALNAKDITLLDGNEETSLVKYFKEKHGRDIAYQDVPVVILSAMRDIYTYGVLYGSQTAKLSRCKATIQSHFCSPIGAYFYTTVQVRHYTF